MKAVNLEKLITLFDQHAYLNNGRRRFSNNFAIACFLHREGHSKAARRQIKEIFDEIGWERRRIYFLDVLDSLSGNEKIYAKAVTACAEFHSLFDD